MSLLRPWACGHVLFKTFPPSMSSSVACPSDQALSPVSSQTNSLSCELQLECHTRSRPLQPRNLQSKHTTLMLIKLSSHFACKFRAILLCLQASRAIEQLYTWLDYIQLTINLENHPQAHDLTRAAISISTKCDCSFNRFKLYTVICVAHLTPFNH